MQYLAMRTQFQRLLNRSDCPDSVAQTYFQMAVQRIQRELRAPFMEATLNIDTTNSVTQVAIPTNFLEVIVFAADDPFGASHELDYVDRGSFLRFSNNSYGWPVYFTRRGAVWYVTDQIDQGSTAYVDYYTELTPLVNNTDEPIYAAIAPDMVIYAALTYAADDFTDDRKDQWEQKYQFFLGQVQGQASDEDLRTGTDAVQPSYQLEDGS